jgi:hypothetical protein
MVIQKTRKIIFLTSGKCFLRSVVKKWYLLDDNLKGNTEQCLNIIDKINRHINFKVLETPRALGVFFINNYENIQLLIPETDKRRRKQLWEYYIGSFIHKNY